MRKRHERSRGLLWLGLAITLAGVLTVPLQASPVMSRVDTRAPGLYLAIIGVAVGVLGLIRQRTGDGNAWYRGAGLVTISVSIVLAALYSVYTYGAFSEEEVTFTNGDVQLAGTLLTPRGEGLHPGLVMIHGAGPSMRMDYFAEAQSLARDGVAVLIYDKRGSGESVGGHPRYDGYDALAEDGVAAVELLRSRPGIDPERVGLWGTSEGGWTAPIAASQIDDLAFLVVVSGGPLTPAELTLYEIESRLTRAGFPAADVEAAVELRSRLDEYITTGGEYEQLEAAYVAARQEDWFEAADDDFPEEFPDYQKLTEYQRWWQDHMKVDVEPLLAQADFPVLFLLGANDPIVPASAIERRVSDIEANGDSSFTVEVFPDATHNLISAPTDCSICIEDGIGRIQPWRFAPGYLSAVSSWVNNSVGRAS